MNRVIPQQPYPFRQPQSTFAFTIQSEFPLFIASGNFAVITSGFTQGGF